MATIINKTEETLELLKEKDKVKTMDSREEMEMILAIDKLMEEISREYQVKENKSQITSASVILTS